MSNRTELQTLLENLLGSRNVYFQPPESIKLAYPCIVYKLDKADSTFANDKPYSNSKRYSVTLIDKNPDNVFVDKLLKLPMCSFDRTFSADNLNHYNFNIYY